MTKIIAEIGWNHMGDIKLANQMMFDAKQSGADFVKFQTWSVDRLKNGSWDSDGRREIYEKAELTFENHKLLKQFADGLGVTFFSSVFSIEDADLLSKIETDYVKIASTESRNYDLLEHVNDMFDNIIVSVGTATFGEVKKILDYIDEDKLTLMHCVSSYPCNYENANLPKINKLKELTSNVGYSDHTLGVLSSIASIEYGVTMIEKHFTIDNNLPGRDNQFAILPEELKSLKNYIELRDVMNVDKGDGHQECELDARENYSGRWNG